MEKRTPLEILRHLGYNGPDWIALFPLLLLDTISADLLLSFDPEDGNDLLAQLLLCLISGPSPPLRLPIT
jgi:hypothetical protein